MRIHEGLPLGPLSSFRTGGSAREVWEVEGPGDRPELEARLGRLAPGRPWVLGGGSNILVSDEGVSEPVVWFRGGSVEVQGTTVHAEAGVDWDHLVRECCRRGLYGLERLSGIPGTVGAAPIQNIGAYGQSVAESVAYVDVMVPGTGLERWSPERCRFSYRSSAFRSSVSTEVVVAVGLRLSTEPTDEALYRDLAAELGRDRPGALTPVELREAVLRVRRRKRLTWVGVPEASVPRNAGSFFVSPRLPPRQARAITAAVVGEERADDFIGWYAAGDDDTGLVKVAAAHVLLACGFRNGDRWGPVQLLPEHVLALTNAGGARSEEIQAVADLIADRARDRFGVHLEQEPRTLGRIVVRPEVRADLERRHRPGDAVPPPWVTTH